MARKNGGTLGRVASAIQALAATSGGQLDRAHLLSVLSREAQALLSADLVGLWVLDAARSELRPVTSGMLTAEASDGVLQSVNASDGVLGQAWQSGEVIVATGEQLGRDPLLAAAVGTHSTGIVLPVELGGRVAVVLLLAADAEPDDVAGALDVLALIASVAILALTAAGLDAERGDTAALDRQQRAIAQAMADSIDEGQLIKFVLLDLLRLLEARFACAWKREGDVLRAIASADLGDAERRLPYLPLDSVAGLALQKASEQADGVVNLADATTHDAWRDAVFGRGTDLGAYLAAPLSVHGQLLGVLEVMREHQRPFTADAERALAGMLRLMSTLWRGLQAQTAEADVSLKDLTPRERDVIELIGRGLTNAQIATALGLRLGTVKLHVQHVLVKLGVASRTQAAHRARELGLTAR
jgi:DNA-binding CsgD family transcriptional regulator/putative methionine-R-sulfoxide reductase with GAF domain